MKDKEGRRLVSGRGAAVIGSLWVLGSVVMGWGTASTSLVPRQFEYTVGYLALGAFPALLLVLVWSYLE